MYDKKETHRLVSIKYDKYDKITGIPQISLSAFLSSLSVSNSSHPPEIKIGRTVKPEIMMVFNKSVICQFLKSRPLTELIDD